MVHHARLAVLCAFVALATPGAAQVPAGSDSLRLLQRMIALHRALAAHDVAGWYALTSPSFRRSMTFEEFKADLQPDSTPVIQPSPDVRVTLERVCGCKTVPKDHPNAGARRCVAILKVADERWFESWDLVAKEWYSVWAEPVDPLPQKPLCPGER